MELNSYIEGYIEMCEQVKKLSSDTIKAYRIDLKQYASFIGTAVDEPKHLLNTSVSSI